MTKPSKLFAKLINRIYLIGTIAVGGTKIFFADFRFTDIKIDTRGFSGTVIPNLATVLLYEACTRHFYQDVVNIYRDQKFIEKVNRYKIMMKQTL